MSDFALMKWIAAREWMREQVRRLNVRDETGAVALEYILIIGIIVIILFSMLYFFIDPVRKMVDNAIQKIKDWTTSAGEYNTTSS